MAAANFIARSFLNLLIINLANLNVNKFERAAAGPD
jgi:hypothetical protein